MMRALAESPAPTILLDLRASERCGRRRWVFGNRNEPMSESAWQGILAHARKLASLPDGPPAAMTPR